MTNTVDPELALMVAEAEIGEEARKFMTSDLGRSILGYAALEVQKYEKALSKHDATDAKGIAALQNKIALYEEFPQWLNELFTNGENARSLFKQRQSGE